MSHESVNTKLSTVSSNKLHVHVHVYEYMCKCIKSSGKEVYVRKLS